MSAPGADPLLGVVLRERYRVVRKIGQGGMGAIYEVLHEKIKRAFALKRLSADLVNNVDAMARFQREAEVVAGLRHPHIVEISDWETLPDGSPCMILEFLSGTDLARRIAQGPMAWEDIARFGDQVMSALAVAHKANIVHRDLKPGNIFLALDDTGEERVKLLDFGISKLRDSASMLTGTSTLMGTPAYMSPEQAYGKAASVGPSTDVWAMGAILYEMATGRVAFKADNVPATLLLITTETPDPIHAFRPDAPAAFVELVAAALSHDPETRIQTIEDLRARLRAALGAPHPIYAHTPPAGVSLVTPSSTGPATPVGAVQTQATGLPTPASSVRSPATTLSHATGQGASMPAPVPAPTRSKRGLLIGIAAAGLGIAATVVVLSTRGGSTGSASSPSPVTTQTASSESTPDTTRPADTANPVETAKPADTPNPVDTAQIADTAKPVYTAKPAERTTREIALGKLPANASITLDRAPVAGSTLTLPLDSKPHTLRISAPGYETLVQKLDARTPATLSVHLRAKKKPITPSEPKPISL